MLVDSSSLEAHTNYMRYIRNKEEWLAKVAELGAIIVDPDGDNVTSKHYSGMDLIVAHIDYWPVGYWNTHHWDWDALPPRRVEIGVIYETESLQLQWD